MFVDLLMFFSKVYCCSIFGGEDGVSADWFSTLNVIIYLIMNYADDIIILFLSNKSAENQGKLISCMAGLTVANQVWKRGNCDDVHHSYRLISIYALFWWLWICDWLSLSSLLSEKGKGCPPSLSLFCKNTLLLPLLVFCMGQYFAHVSYVERKPAFSEAPFHLESETEGVLTMATPQRIQLYPHLWSSLHKIHFLKFIFTEIWTKELLVD